MAAAAAAREIRHRQVEANGITMHVAESGPASAAAPTVLFVHGFPELWYSWRHQMLAVAAAGYRAIAPDWRGYGLSDQPPEPEAAAYSDLTEDLLAVLDALSVPIAILVAAGRRRNIRPGPVQQEAVTPLVAKNDAPLKHADARCRCGT